MSNLKVNAEYYIGYRGIEVMLAVDVNGETTRRIISIEELEALSAHFNDMLICAKGAKKKCGR